LHDLADTTSANGCTRADTPCFSRSLCQQEAGGFVQWTTAGEAEDGTVRRPGSFCLLGVEHGNVVGKLLAWLDRDHHILAQLLYHLLNRIAHLELLFARQLSLRRIALRKAQGPHRHGIVVGRQGLLPQSLFGHIGGFRTITGKKPLIEAFLGFEGRFVAKQHLDEL
jgi:hypothetical protein